MRRDEKDDGTVGGWPHRQHPIAAVEVSAAHVVEILAGEPIARGLASPILHLADDSERHYPATAAERSDLPISDSGQRDFDRRLVSRFRSSAISALRSSPSGSTRPAR